MENVTDPDFRTALHAGFEAPRAVVVDVITRSTHLAVDHLHRLELGDENEIYRARLSDGAVVYVRIRRPGEKETFESEAWAMDQARAAGLPLPRVLSIGEIPTEAGPRSAMVITEAPGRQLVGLLPELRAHQRQHVMTSLGQLLARLHTVTTPGVGRPDSDGAWPDPQQRRRVVIAERIRQRRDLLAAGLTPAEADIAIDQLERSPDTPATTNPVLCHGDLHPAHVFVTDDLRVCGIIDWGLWHGGSVIGELAAMSLTYRPTDLDAILAGHGIDRDDAELRQRFARSVISHAVGRIAWTRSIGNAAGTAHRMAALRDALTQID